MICLHARLTMEGRSGTGLGQDQAHTASSRCKQPNMRCLHSASNACAHTCIASDVRGRWMRFAQVKPCSHAAARSAYTHALMPACVHTPAHAHAHTHTRTHVAVDLEGGRLAPVRRAVKGPAGDLVLAGRVCVGSGQQHGGRPRGQYVQYRYNRPSVPGRC